MNLHEFRQSGFSLVELTVVLLLMTLIAGVAVRQTTELGFQSRYDLTRDRLEQIKQAILGDPKRVSNGQRAINGFVADMGRLPDHIQELIEQPGDCNNDAGDRSQRTCVNLPAPGVWTADPLRTQDPVSGLWYGWNGPYLDVSANPDADDAFTDGWGTVSDDGNYGWRFEPGLNPVFLGDGSPLNDQNDPDGLTRLIVQSLGLDQQLNGSDFDADFPANEQANDAGVLYPSPLVDRQDWLVDISGGISVQFIKLNRLVPLSFCSDSTKTTQSLCTSPNIWYGGCSLPGYYNKKSCEEALPTPGTWDEHYLLQKGYCSDRSKTTQDVCLAPAVWTAEHKIGKGFGCSDQTITQKAECSSPRVWYACSDSSKTTQSACTGAADTWYGDDLGENLSKLPINSLPVADNNVPLCMSIFFRSGNGAVQKISSIQPKSLWIDGSEGAIHFDGGFVDDDANPVSLIPMGQTAIGIYQYDGNSCKSSTVYYPVHHQNPILVDLHPKTHVPVINW